MLVDTKVLLTFKSSTLIAYGFVKIYMESLIQKKFVWHSFYTSQNYFALILKMKSVCFIIYIYSKNELKLLLNQCYHFL